MFSLTNGHGMQRKGRIDHGEKMIFSRFIRDHRQGKS